MQDQRERSAYFGKSRKKPLDRKKSFHLVSDRDSERCHHYRPTSQRWDCALPWRGIRRCRPSVCPSVCYIPVGLLYRNEWTNRADFLATHSTLRVIRKLGFLRKCGYFRLKLCPKLWTRFFAVDKTTWRSLLITSAAIVASWLFARQ